MKQLSLLCLLFAANSLFGQINWQDSTVQAITYWGLYDSMTYEVQLEKTKTQNGDTTLHDLITYDVGVTVIDSTASAYLLAWHYYNFNYEGNNPVVEQTMGISENITVQIKTDELGVVLGVENWEEVRDYTYGLIDEVLQGENIPSTVKSVLKGMKKFYATPEGLANLAIQDAMQFHTFFGAKYKLGEVIEDVMSLPNLYSPDEPFDADFSVELEAVDTLAYNYSLRYVQEIDKEQLMSTTIKYLKSIGMPDELLADVDPESMKNHLVSAASFTNDGWLLHSEQVKTVSMDEFVELEIRTIVLK